MHALSDLPVISHMLMIVYDKSYLYMMMNRLNPSEQTSCNTLNIQIIRLFLSKLPTHSILFMYLSACVLVFFSSSLKHLQQQTAASAPPTQPEQQQSFEQEEHQHKENKKVASKHSQKHGGKPPPKLNGRAFVGL